MGLREWQLQKHTQRQWQAKFEFCVEQFVSHSFPVHSYFTPLNSYNSSEVKEHLSGNSHVKDTQQGRGVFFLLSAYPRLDVDSVQLEPTLEN